MGTSQSVILLFHLLVRLENGREQTLVLHKRAVMMVRTFPDDVAGYTVRDVVFEVGVEGLVLAVFDFKVCEIATTMLSSKWAFLHVDRIGILGLLLFVDRVVV